MDLLTALLSITPKSPATEVVAEILTTWSEAGCAKALDGLGHLIDDEDSCSDEQTLYLIHLVSGSLYCADGQTTMARKAFQKAEALHLEDDYRSAILSSKTAWLHLITCDLEAARDRINTQPRLGNAPLNAHNEVIMGLIHYGEGSECQAEEYLFSAANYYTECGNDDALSMIQLYQAAIHLDLGCSKIAAEHLAQGLTWMEKSNKSDLPYWWHPQMIANLLKKAEQLHIAPNQSSRILSQQREVGKAPSVQATPVKPKARPDAVYVNRAKQQGRKKSFSQKVQAEFNLLLQSGIIDKANLPELAQKIPHGATDGQINPAILAVFGLHVQHLHNRDIAVRLELANNTVRSYVTKIYGAFELDIKDYHSPEARRLALLENAKEEGYIN